MSRGSVTDRLISGAPAFSATLIGTALALVVGLPLTSPDDLLGNTASIAVLSNAGAVVLGVIWAYSRRAGERRVRVYTSACIALYVVTVVIALLVEFAGELLNTVSYVVPIASVIFVSTAVFTPTIERNVNRSAWLYLGLTLSIATLSAGIVMALNEVGFTEPPSLSLPPPA